MNNFYIYKYVRNDGTPYYIGKGHDNRINEAHRFPLPVKKRRIIIKSNLTESEAFDLEIELIALLGRKDQGTGILINLTDGGEGASGRTGFKHSDETKKKISDTRKALFSSSSPIAEKLRKKLSVAALNKPPMSQLTKDLLSAMAKGKSKSELTKRLMSKPKSEAHKKALSEALRGKPKSDEHRKNLSEAVKKYMTPEHRAKLSIAALNRKKK